jgi:hypothetical protein
MNALKDPAHFSFSPRAYSLTEQARAFLPNEEEMLAPPYFDELQRLLLTPVKKAKEVGQSKREEIGAAIARLNDKKSKLEGYRNAVVKRQNEISADYKAGIYTTQEEVEQATNRVKERTKKIKLKLLTQINGAIDELMKILRESIPTYPGCAERSDFVKACCSYMNALLTEYHFATEFPILTKKYPDDEINRLSKLIEEGKMTLADMDARIVEVFEDGATENWETIRADHNLLLFQRTFIDKLDKNERVVTQAHIENLFVIINNLQNAACITAWSKLGRPSVPVPSADSMPKEQALQIFEKARTGSISPPPDAESWPARFEFEWKMIRRMETGLGSAVSLFVMNKRRSQAKNPEKSAKDLQLNKQYWSKRRAHEVITKLEKFADDLEFMQQDLMKKCGASLAGEGTEAAAIELDLSDFRYTRLAVLTYAEGLRAYLQFLPVVPEPKLPTVTSAPEQAPASEEEIREEQHEPGPADIKEVIADVERLQMQEALPSGATPAPKPAGKPAKPVPRKTFDEVRDLFTTAKNSFKDGEDVLESSPVKDAVSEVEDKIEFAQRTFETAFGRFKDLRQAMKQSHVLSVYDVDLDKLEILIRDCGSRIELCKHYLQLNGLRVAGNGAFSSGEHALQWQQRMGTISGENGAIEFARDRFASALANFEQLSQQMTEHGVLSIHEHKQRSLARRIQDCQNKIALCNAYFADLVGQSPEEDVLAKLELRDGFRTSLMMDEAALKDRKLAIVFVNFPRFSGAGGFIQRNRHPLHYHLEGVNSFAELRELCALGEEAVGQAIGFASGRPHGPGIDPVTQRVKPRYLLSKQRAVRYLMSAVEQADRDGLILTGRSPTRERGLPHFATR